MAILKKQISLFNFLKVLISNLTNTQISTSNLIPGRKISAELKEKINEGISDYGLIVFYFLVLDSILNQRIIVDPDHLYRIFSEAYFSVIKENNPDKTKKEIQIELLFNMEKIQQYEKYIRVKLLMNNNKNLDKTSYDYLVWRAFADQIVKFEGLFRNNNIDFVSFLKSIKENIINPIKFMTEAALREYVVIP